MPSKEHIMWEMLRIAYAEWLRDLLEKAIEDPDSEVDEHALKICDLLLGYAA